MRLAKYIGKKRLVRAGHFLVKPGETVGPVGSEGIADLAGTPGLVDFLLTRADFEAIDAATPKDGGETSG